MMPNFTPLEMKLLKALFKSSADNGHDFGCIEDARGAVGKAQLGALVSSLVKKGAIEVFDPVVTIIGINRTATWTQFKFHDLSTIKGVLS